MTKLERLCANQKAPVVIQWKRSKVKPPDDFPRGSSSYRIQITYRNRMLSIPFFCGPGVKTPLKTVHVIAALIANASAGKMSFSDFCHKLGYNKNSTEDHNQWRRCRRMTKSAGLLFGADYDKFAAAASDY